MLDAPEDVRQELRGSLNFVVAVLVSGALIFSVFFNLCYLAVQYDLRLQSAYLVLAHPAYATSEQIAQAIATLDELLAEDARDGGRPILCEQDLSLIELLPSLPPPQAEQAATLLARKTGRDADWLAFYLEHLPRSRSPYQMPFLELSLLYYGWLIEIATIICLSQSLRKPHVQEALHRAAMNPRYFLPLTSLMLFVPFWTGAGLLYPQELGVGMFVGMGLASTWIAGLLFKVAKTRLIPSRMNELGFHVLIASLFIQLLTVMGDPDVVYSVFSADRMRQLRYGTWFILACYPLLLLEVWWRRPVPDRAISG